MLELLRSAGDDIAPKGEGVSQREGRSTSTPREWQVVPDAPSERRPRFAP